MEVLTFTKMQIIEETTRPGERYINPSKETFDSLPETFSHTQDSVYFDIVVEKDDDYIFFIFKYGNTEPWDENLTHIHTGVKKPNQRAKDETELNKQAFFLYHYKNKILYVSNSQRKSLFQSILKDKIQRDFIIKSIYIDEDEFIKTLNECSEISFTHVENIFSHNSKKKQALVDLSGIDSPNEFTIFAKYKRDNTLIKFIKELIMEKREQKIKGLTICGLDENGLNMVYNVDSFTQKIKVLCPKDDNKQFIDVEVKERLLQEIKNERY
jgi:hypothetical protein